MLAEFDVITAVTTYREYGYLACNATYRRQPDVPEDHIASIFREEE
jgi:hypothetical protein